MIHRKIHINGWVANVFFCITHYDESILANALKSVNAPIGVIVRMREIAREDEYNTGFTFSNPELRESVVVIGKATDASQFLNTFVHEVRHLSDDIAHEYRIQPRGEEVAYLEGNIATQFTDIVGHFLCPHCRKDTKKRTKRVG